MLPILWHMTRSHCSRILARMLQFIYNVLIRTEFAFEVFDNVHQLFRFRFPSAQQWDVEQPDYGRYIPLSKRRNIMHTKAVHIGLGYLSSGVTVYHVITHPFSVFRFPFVRTNNVLNRYRELLSDVFALNFTRRMGCNWRRIWFVSYYSNYFIDQ